jgi:hypothetical protein
VDFVILLRANDAFLAGFSGHDAIIERARATDPWKRPYPYGPLVYRVLLPISYFSELTAHVLWALAFPVIFGACLAAVSILAYPALAGRRGTVAVVTLLVFATSAPAILQMERGNFDWLVMSVYLCGVALMAGRWPIAGGALLAAAAFLKLYPVIALPVLVVLGRWKEAAGAAIATVAILLLTGVQNNLQWIAAVGRDRTGFVNAGPWNTALANVVAWIAGVRLSHVNTERVAHIGYIVLILLFLGILAWRRYRGERIRVAPVTLVIVPFMFMMPHTVWFYTLFSLIAVLPALASVSVERPDLRRATLACGVFVGLCQIPIQAFCSGRPDVERLLAPLYALSLLALGLGMLWLLARGVFREDAPLTT